MSCAGSFVWRPNNWYSGFEMIRQLPRVIGLASRLGGSDGGRSLMFYSEGAARLRRPVPGVGLREARICFDCAKAAASTRA